MLGTLQIRPDDRILLLGIPEPDLIRNIAAQAANGVVVGLGTDDAVREARRLSSDVHNVMLVPAPTEEIPWQDQFFTLAIDPETEWTDADATAEELARVMGPGGEVHGVSGEEKTDALLAEGFAEIKPGVFTKLL
jgi:hypothetical protein